MGGYFELIAPYFEEFVRKKNGVNITSLNVRIIIGGDDLSTAIAASSQMLVDFSKLSDKWRFHHGWVKAPGKEAREIVVTLYRKRLINVVRWMNTQFVNAQRENKCIVFGNGVFLRILAGMPNEGSLVYS